VQDQAFGADPYGIVAIADDRLVGILRGADSLVVLDPSLGEVARLATPRSPSAIAVYHGVHAGALEPGDVLVTSELEPILAHYRHGARGTLERLPDIDLGDAYAVRGVATGPEGVVYLIEEHDDRLITLAFSGAQPTATRTTTHLSRGPMRVLRTGRTLFVTTLIDHGISAFRLDARGLVAGAPVTVMHDGPFWGLDAAELGDTGEDALILAGGAENHALDRGGGFFGYVDSFVYAYRWKGQTGELARVAEINVGEQGLIVPKAITFDAPKITAGLRASALVTSYGAPAALRVVWSDGVDVAPTTTPIRFVPGASSVIALGAGGKKYVAADPLFDSWVSLDAQEQTQVVRAPSRTDTRTDRERLGEALFFTGLMAPASSAEGAKSRFSCETCHFEGYVDGRTHHTGRGDIRATTKPLVGLFNNRPHFSRALDPDLSAVAENEFRVAGAPSPTAPHFDVDVKDVPWIAYLGLHGSHYDATELRLSLMAFLMRWTHRTNPRAAKARAFTAEERAGAAAFRDRCQHCHEARSAADDPKSRVPFERWESLVLGGSGPIVWASDAYEKTGIVPYVHDFGARVPSLRRLYKKRPYFTTGSAPDVMSVLHTARFDGATFTHGGRTDGEALDEPTARAIAAFLDLL
jgi:hypothetical protein